MTILDDLAKDVVLGDPQSDEVYLDALLETGFGSPFMQREELLERARLHACKAVARNSGAAVSNSSMRSVFVNYRHVGDDSTRDDDLYEVSEGGNLLILRKVPFTLVSGVDRLKVGSDVRVLVNVEAAFLQWSGIVERCIVEKASGSLNARLNVRTYRGEGV